MVARAQLATAMAFRDQRRRPLVLILLVVVPAYVVTRSIAMTEATPRRIGLPGDIAVTTTMKDLHGAVMAGTAIAFVAALVGVFVMQSALQGDRRLVLAGYRPGETVLRAPRGPGRRNGTRRRCVRACHSALLHPRLLAAD